MASHVNALITTEHMGFFGSKEICFHLELKDLLELILIFLSY